MDIQTLIVGKSGVTDEFIVEARAQLHKHRRIRIRFLKSARAKSDRKSIADEITSKIPSALLEDARGNTIILSRK